MSDQNMPRNSVKPGLVIVDDDIQVVKQLKWKFLGRVEIFHALNEIEAEAYIVSNRICMILVDLHMPPKLHEPEVGLKLISTLKRKYTKHRIIGISVNTDAGIEAAVLSAGADGFYLKPFSEEALNGILSQCS